MKKYLSIILALLLVFALCACTNDVNEDNNASQIVDDFLVEGSTVSQEDTTNVDNENSTTTSTTSSQQDKVSSTTESSKKPSSSSSQQTVVSSENETSKNQSATSSGQSSAQTNTSSKPVTSTNSSTTSSGVHTHSYSDWKILTYPTCKAEGKRQRTCTCGVAESLVLPKLYHNYNDKGICNGCGYADPNAFVSDTPAAKANTIGAERGDARVTAQGDWLYFVNGKSIVKTKKDGSSRKTVYTVSAGNTLNINVLGDWIYFSVDNKTAANSYMAKVRTDGAGFKKILTSVMVREILVLKDRIYFTSIVSPYKNYAKDCCPLYAMSLDGGMTQQVHDGYVSNLTADSTYIYFSQTPRDANPSIFRMKHNGSSKNTLLSNKDFNYMVLENSRLYFLLDDRYSDEYAISSIAINGGSITTHGKVPFYSEWIAVIGQKLYYSGAPYIADGFSEDCGIVEFNLSTKKYTMIKRDFDNPLGFVAGNRLFITNGENSYNVYDPSTKKLTSIKTK